MEQKSNKTIVRECYRKIIRDLDLSLVDTYIRKDYIQHSPTVKDGRAGLLEMVDFLKTIPRPKEESPSPVIRVIAEGDLVAVHLDIQFMGKRAAVIDLFRLENGQIAEHWDGSQLIPDDESGPVTMTNGTTVIDETADANESKMLVKDFYHELLENKSSMSADKYFHRDYTEHNPPNGLMDNADGMVKVHRIIAEGDFVVSQCEYKVQGSVFARYSIFRVADNKIAEHWSVEQEVPAVMAHPNGMF
ncbi:MAG: putative SnoaL-like aldol condensation-catalyzing enzyme [Mucilaginibacter sp.]|nr:putative SnoaL-like aldol condensation-catalyzing enzyme [Mucilaginibacter sp.]